MLLEREYIQKCEKASLKCCFMEFCQAVIRALCTIIDAFHFPTAAMSAEGGADISTDAAEIQTALTKRVLPALQVHLVWFSHLL